MKQQSIKKKKKNSNLKVLSMNYIKSVLALNLVYMPLNPFCFDVLGDCISLLVYR
jgi:hypothetical protein